MDGKRYLKSNNCLLSNNVTNKIKPSSNKEKLVYIKMVKINDNKEKLTIKQQAAYDYLKNSGPISLTDLNKAYPNMSRALIRKM